MESAPSGTWLWLPYLPQGILKPPPQGIQASQGGPPPSWLPWGLADLGPWQYCGTTLYQMSSPMCQSRVAPWLLAYFVAMSIVLSIVLQHWTHTMGLQMPDVCTACVHSAEGSCLELQTGQHAASPLHTGTE